MTKLNHFMPKNVLLKIYYSFIHPHLIYGVSIWGATFPSYRKKLQTLQNKAIKLIGGGSYRDKATPFYSKLKILKLQDLFKFEIGKLAYSYFQNKLPQQLSNPFKLTSQTSQYNTRSSQKSKNCLYIPRYRTQHLQKSIKYQEVKIWNDIHRKYRIHKVIYSNQDSNLSYFHNISKQK